MRNINDLTEALFDTIEKLKKGEIEVSAANAIASVGSNIIQAGKLEFEFLKYTEQTRSAFFLEASKQNELIEARVRFEVQKKLEEKQKEEETKFLNVVADKAA